MQFNIHTLSVSCEFGLCRFLWEILGSLVSNWFVVPLWSPVSCCLHLRFSCLAGLKSCLSENCHVRLKQIALERRRGASAAGSASYSNHLLSQSMMENARFLSAGHIGHEALRGSDRFILVFENLEPEDEAGPPPLPPHSSSNSVIHLFI